MKTLSKEIKQIKVFEVNGKIFRNQDDAIAHLEEIEMENLKSTLNPFLQDCKEKDYNIDDVINFVGSLKQKEINKCRILSNKKEIK